jgi:2-hydroxychromene-2-carboxylate isomerase
LSFPSDATQPDAQEVSWASAALAGVSKPDDVPAMAVAVGTALWGGDRERLRELAADGRFGPAAAAAGNAERARLGHYLSAMLYFEGEWYWGVDRLNHLEERLADLGLDSRVGEPPIAAYREVRLAPPPPCAEKATIEVWFSFRSPYSWIAFPRLRQLAHHHGAELRLRYILPMVMRGLPVPRIKSTYIMLDAKREAERAGLPFGRIVDPVGIGVERALAVLHHAVPLGLGEEFAERALRAAFAEGVDLAQDAGLHAVARAAGLDDAQIVAALADPSWRETAEENRKALLDAGLWGAPTYRVDGGPAHWGQDRLWALEQDLLAAASR